ncbi:MAG: MOSC domain-containing protein [Bacteroidota bacterium]
MEKDFLKKIYKVGKVEWIGIRPERRANLSTVSEIKVTEEEGIIGDHYKADSKKRQVTLIQKENLQAVASVLGKPSLDPALTRRNILVSGINLNALREQVVQVGDVVLEITGLCHPCSRMEENFGPGAYQAMRGHGGLTARVLQGGTISIGSEVKWLHAIEKEASVK